MSENEYHQIFFRLLSYIRLNKNPRPSLFQRAGVFSVVNEIRSAHLGKRILEAFHGLLQVLI